MKRITHITPVISRQISLGINYILMSDVRGEMYILSEDDSRFVKKFGIPDKWKLHSCIIDEIPDDAVTNKMVPYCDTPMRNNYDLCRHETGHASLVIDWGV